MSLCATSMAAMRGATILLALAFAPHASAGDRYIRNQTIATSTCNGAFNTACSITITHDIVDALAEELMSAASVVGVNAVLFAVTNGAAPYSQSLNFWSTVLDASGNFVASGRPNVPGWLDPVGRHVEDVALELSLIHI